MTYQLSDKSRAHRLGVNNKLIEIDDLALEISPIDFGIPDTGGLRTTRQQQRLCLDGKSKCNGVDDISKHQQGLALDFYAYVDGKASWDKLHLAIVAAAHLQAASELGYAIEWGGLWKTFKDYPHIQLII